MKQFSFLTALAACILYSTFAQTEPEADPNELLRIAATEPADAHATFEIRPGFKLELAASEPLVVDPIDIEFDEAGRLFAVEMRGYSERREDALGRIKLLVDENDDGIFDRATIYAEGLKWPTSVCCYDGGIFVAASPDIFYFKDTDGDGVSDIKEIVFTGFGATASRLNMQALVNSLTWGPDNRIWGATARNGGLVRRPDQPESEAINLQGADFSFDPKKRDLRAENGTAQFGMSFDSLGRRFVSSNSNHIQWVAWERDAQPINEYYAMPSPLVSIATAGGAAPVYRISPDEPWRIVRTRWRVSGVVQGMIEGGGRVSGYFTSATGITLYTGDAYGASFHDNAFIGDAGSNLIHRKNIRNEPGKRQPIAERADDEAEIEFLRSSDNWFRPVNFANGPDGCLYICDMYREVIEHPWSLPPGIKKHIDLNSGHNRGRIWRVVPIDFKRPAFSLQRDSGWQHVTNRRLAFESGKPEPKTPPSISAPSYDLSDPWSAAFALRKLATPAAMIESWKNRYTALAYREQLAEMMGKTGDANAIRAVIGSLAATGVTSDSQQLLIAFGNGLLSSKSSLSQADPGQDLAPHFTAAHHTAIDANAREQDRAKALKLIALDPSAAALSSVRKILADTNASDALRSSAIAALDSRPNAAEALIESWDRFSTKLKTAAISILIARPKRARSLLEAVETGLIPQIDIPLSAAVFLRNHEDASVRALAAKAMPARETISRQTVVDRYLAALNLEGDPQRGKAVYQEAACFTCHRSPDGEGYALGPDLVTFKAAGGDSIINNLFDPNAEVAPQYQAYIFSLKNGESFTGIITREDPTDVAVRMAGGGEKTFARKDVASMQGLGQSLMPEGMEAILSQQNVADLLSFIDTAE